MRILWMQSLALLIFCAPAFANNGDNPPTKPNSENSSFTFYNIFFTDSENDVLFIDFEVIKDDLKSVNVLKNGEIMLADDVSDLASNDIYEVNYSIFKKGSYTVEIVTEHDIVIQKRIIVD